MNSSGSLPPNISPKAKRYQLHLHEVFEVLTNLLAVQRTPVKAMHCGPIRLTVRRSAAGPKPVDLRRLTRRHVRPLRNDSTHLDTPGWEDLNSRLVACEFEHSLPVHLPNETKKVRPLAIP
jgi:hypothetical protein